MSGEAPGPPEEAKGATSSHEVVINDWDKEQVVLGFRPEDRFKVTAAIRDQVTIVIPTLNEEEAIGPLVDEIMAAKYGMILAVDGSSKDKTVEEALGRGASVIMQQGKGKAGALSTAFKSVSAPYVVVMDGDGSYDPADIDKYLTLLNEFSFVESEQGMRI